MKNIVKVSDLFEVRYGVNLELINLNEVSERGNKAVSFVSRTESNNGVSAFVERDNDITPIPAGTLTVAGGGSVLATFLQPYEYYSGRDLFYLVPKRKMSERELIYYSICIHKNKYRYSYNRQANRTLRDILIPAEVPQKFINLKIKKLSNKSASNKKNSLSNRKWRSFLIKDLFKLERGKCGSAEKLLEKGGEINYIGAKKDNNGSMYKVVRNEKFVTKGNCIVFIGDGQGSVGYTTYQPDDFIGSTTLSVGRNKNLDKYSGLFIVTLLDRERFKYSFGRKWNGEKLKNTKIKLPVDKNGSPDWKFMEDYIKSLPYSAEI